MLILAVLVSGCVTQNPYKAKIGGKEVDFRADLNEARKVPVYPSEFALKELLLHEGIERVRIAFIPNEQENPFYAVDGFEISFKLTTIYIVYFGYQIPIESLEVNTTSEAFANATYSEPVILILGPATGANQTAVTVANNTVVVEGHDLSEIDRKYTDLDLAVDKMLLVLIGE
ncbi:MAG: hypothetical protein ACE5J7_03375 [Candidatus Aenigmatarchaeota archaeon]